MKRVTYALSDEKRLLFVRLQEEGSFCLMETSQSNKSLLQFIRNYDVRTATRREPLWGREVVSFLDSPCRLGAAI